MARDDLEWEVRHTKSTLYKGRGQTPEAALADLYDCFRKGVEAAEEAVDRERQRLDKLRELSRQHPPLEEDQDADPDIEARGAALQPEVEQ